MPVGVKMFDEPLGRHVEVLKDGVDFAAVDAEMAKSGCEQAEVSRALFRTGVMLFETLWSLAGETLTGPLRQPLEEQDKSRAAH